MVKPLRLLGFALLLLSAACTANGDSPNMSHTYEWVPTETAPREYPVFVISGVLTLADGTVVGVPDARLANAGWGQIGSVQLIGPDQKAVPVTLELAWYSFLEDKYYQGKFDLPRDKIEAWLASGGGSEIAGEKQVFDRLVIGMAPGGDVNLWVGGGRVVHQVAMFHAGPGKFSVSDMSQDPDLNITQFTDQMLKTAMPPEVLENVRAKPVPAGKWRTFETRYNWMPVVRGLAQGDLLWIATVNGELNWFDLSGLREAKMSLNSLMALPQKLELNWQTPDRQKALAEVVFDDDETHEAFAKMAQRVGDQSLQLSIEPGDLHNNVEILLHGGDAVYRFSKAKVTVMKR